MLASDMSVSITIAIEVDNATIQSGFPCKDFTGYCDKSGYYIM